MNTLAAGSPGGSVRPSVLMAVEQLALSARTMLAEAIGDAGAVLVPWTPREQLRTAERPSLLVTGLPSGRRRLPDDLGDLLGRDFPRLKVLVLCEEPLRRRVMSSHGGRVVLLGQPYSLSQLSSRLRMLLSGRPVARGTTGFRQATTEECLDAYYWVGTGCSSDSNTAPLLRRDSVGITVLVSLPGTRMAVAVVDRVVAALSANTRDEQTLAALSALLGDEHAAIHLSKASEEWRLYCPWSDRMHYLCSPERFPSMWDFSSSFAKRPFLRLSAAAGDLFLSSTAPRPFRGPDPELLSEGGPAVLSALLGQRPAGGESISGTVVEIL